MGDVVCPVVPVLIGDTPTGRTASGLIASGLIARAGLVAHLVEQPAVASDAARFRLQPMADHSDKDVGHRGRHPRHLHPPGTFDGSLKRDVWRHMAPCGTS